jgi:hypothetical protein
MYTVRVGLDFDFIVRKKYSTNYPKEPAEPTVIFIHAYSKNHDYHHHIP